MTRRLLSCAVLAISAAACGDVAPAPSAPREDGAADARSTSGAGGSSAGRERAAAPVVVTRAEVEAFVAALSAEEDEAICERLVAEFVARGDAALDAVVDALRGDPSGATCHVLRRVIAKFGAKGWLAVARAMPGLRGDAGDEPIEWLQEHCAEWRFDPLGPDICRALVAAIDATSATDERERRWALWAALAESRPAGSAVAADLAKRLATQMTVEHEQVATVLAALGSDAVAGAPALLPLLRSDDDRHREFARWVLGAIGSADPSILPALREVLTKGTPAQRRDVCLILANWGDAAAEAGPDLVALVSVRPADDETEAANAAMDALRSITAIGGTAAVAILEAQSQNGGLDTPGFALLSAWVKDPATAATLVRAAPTLSNAAAFELLRVLRDAPGPARVDAASRLLSHAAPDARAYAAEVLIEAGETASPRILTLLDDPAASVRAYTARALAEAGALPPERVRAVLLPLREDADEDTRGAVIAALIEANAIEASDTDWLVRAAHDEATREIALQALATRDGPLPPGLADIAPALARAAIADSYPYERDAVIAWLERIPRGIDTLLDTMPKWLAEYDDSGDWIRCLDTVAALGPRAAPLRERLVALRAAAREDSGYRDELDRALASIDGDLDLRVASSVYLGSAEIADLIRRGDAGRLALVLAAGYRTNDADRILEHIPRDAAMQEAVRIAATRRSSDPGTDATEDIRRTGAARLASILPPTEAADLLTRLASDPNGSVCIAAADTLDTMSVSDAGAVPLGALVTLLALPGDDDGDARFYAARAASRLGPRAADLLPRLREIAARAPARDGVMAGIAAWRIGGRPDDALPGVRRAIDEKPEFAARTSSWAEIGASLAELPLDDADLPRLLRSFEASWWNSWRSAALIRGLTRFGARAATAVPTVRSCLANSHGTETLPWESPDLTHPDILLSEAAARLLLVVGPAARDALPDLRHAASVTTDPTGVLRDAIRRIESAPR